METNWKEAKEQSVPIIRWEDPAPKDHEEDMYLGAKVQGIYAERKDNLGPQQSTMYIIDVPGVGKVGIWGCKVLDAKMNLVKVGEEVQINFLGSNPSKNKAFKPWKNFSVFSAKPVTQMVEAAPAGATAPAAALVAASALVQPATSAPTTAGVAAPAATEADPY